MTSAEITDADLQDMAVQIETTGGNPVIRGEVVSSNDLSVDQMTQLQELRQAYRASNPPVAPIPQTPNDEFGGDPNTTLDGQEVLAGSVVTPDGFTLVGRIEMEDEMNTIAVENVQEKIALEYDSGVSIAYEEVGPTDPTTELQSRTYQGLVRGRIIHDGYVNLYVFRKDEDDTTTFKAVMGHG